MSPLNSHTLRWRGGWARIGPFRSDADVARLTMGTDAPPSPSVIERCLGEVQARSYKAVVTNALSQADSAPFVDAGFAVRERLHLLAHDLDQLPPSTGSTRRAHRHDHAFWAAIEQLANGLAQGIVVFDRLAEGFFQLRPIRLDHRWPMLQRRD